MKKLLSVLMIGLFALILNAADAVSPKCDEESAIRKVYAEQNQAAVELNMREMIKFYAPEYTEKNAETGEIVTLRDILDYIVLFDGLNLVKNPKTVVEGFYKTFTAMGSDKWSKELNIDKEQKKAINALKKIFSPDITLSEFMVAAAEMANEKIPPAQIAEMKEVDKRPEAKHMLETLRREMVVEMQKDFNFAEITKELQTYMKGMADSFSIKSIRVTGEKAVVVYHAFDSGKNKTEETTANLVKRDGKWLILAEVIKYIDKK